MPRGSRWRFVLQLRTLKSEPLGFLAPPPAPFFRPLTREKLSSDLFALESRLPGGPVVATRVREAVAALFLGLLAAPVLLQAPDGLHGGANAPCVAPLAAAGASSRSRTIHALQTLGEPLSEARELRRLGEELQDVQAPLTLSERHRHQPLRIRANSPEDASMSAVPIKNHQSPIPHIF